MTLADEVLRMVHAFSDTERKDAVRDLARRVAELETRLAEAEESCSMACETPADDCDCAGCLYAAEHYAGEQEKARG